MPKEGQISVTIPDWVWDLAVKYFEKHEEELKFRHIRSVTALITRWILESSRKEPNNLK